MSEAAVAVRWLLDQAEPEARRVAVQQIAKVRGREAPELLLRALSDDDWRVRKEAAAAAPALERREEVVAALAAALEETVNIGLRNAAVEALVSIGPDAVGVVIDSLVRLDADARKLAVEVLGGVADPRGTAALARALDDDDANVRAAAAEALGNSALAGEASRELATQALVASLATQDAFLKIAALDSLARLEARLPWSVFEPYSTDPLLRRYAIAAATGAREPEAVRALAHATGDTSPTIAREALLSLGDFIAAAPDDKLLESAREAFLATPAGWANARRAVRDGEDAGARACALLVLSLLRDADDVPALVEALEEDDVAERAHMALRLFGPGAVAPLLEAARHAEPAVRAAALTVAASLPDAPVSGVLDELRRALDEPSPEVVSCAVVALGRLGEASDLRRLAKRVKHADERLAAAAVNAVAELAARDVGAARSLLQEARVGRGDPVVLGCVLLGAIATTQPLDEDDVGLLVRALAHDDPRVRRASIEALARAGGEAAADAVVFGLADEEHDVQLAAVRALGVLGRAEPLVGVVTGVRDPVLAATALRALGDANPEAALDAARPLVGQHDAAIACAAVEAIGQLAAARASGRILPHVVSGCEDALFEALEHQDAEVVKVALSIVAELPGVRALARLGLCLDHGSWEVRRLAAELLGHDKSPAAQGLLQARYEREKDPVVREAIASAVSLRAGPDQSRSAERRDLSIHGFKEGT
ncbi:MAG TPA: HEAT repeat domain-containing protein [Polyangiaceae bacterium]|nr:HEAT repeat domain-containing protein [Polyangiaceae bacterium]